ncbi:MAG: hypothetical protein ABIH24_04615 [Verrucomicrobiota bacterium]
MKRTTKLSGRLCALYVALTLAACLQTGAGEARGQDAKAQPARAPALESIRLDPLFPKVSDMPAFGKLKWRRFKGNLATDQVHKEDRAVSSGMCSIGYIELYNVLAEQKKAVENAQTYLQKLPARHAAALKRERADLAKAESYARQKAHNKSLQQQYIDKAAALREKIAGLEKAYPDDLADAEKALQSATDSLAKLEKESPEALAMRDLNMSAILQVISGIQYLEDPDGWMKAIGAYDPLFRKANSAGVGEYSILSPKQHFYDVRFKRGKYIVSIMVTRGPGSGKFDVGIHEAGKAIALAYDRALGGDVPAISVENNPDTHRPYAGLVADGSNTLAISIFIPEADGGVKVEGIKLGVLEQRKGDAWEPLGNRWDPVKTINIPLTETGNAALRYRPPDYLRQDTLKQTTPIHPKDEPDIRYAEEILSFSYATRDGKKEKVDIPLRIFRPPVVLVHGFTGGLSTWELLDNKLTREGWDTRRDEYYFGKQGIADQAELLRSNIQNIKYRYRDKDVKILKVDIVCHSMGGLISRYYISAPYAQYGGDVRKLIMVATPNHGASLTEKWIGNASSFFAGFAHSKAANELHGESAIITELNKNEAVGGHLRPEVQYAVLYGQRRNYWLWGLWAADSYYPNDGVVSVDSALLNGVPAYLFNGTLHSGAIKAVYPKDDNICEDIPVFQKIEELLMCDIPRVELNLSDAVISQTAGTAQHWKYGHWQTVKVGDSVRRNRVQTGPDSSAEIHFFQTYIPFARIELKADTRLEIFHADIRCVRVHIYVGQARFVMLGGQKSSVEILAGTETSDLLFSPLARIMHLDTDFDVRVRDGNVAVYSREGRVGVEYWDTAAKPQGKLLTGGQGVSLVNGTDPVDMNEPLDNVPGAAPPPQIQKPPPPPPGQTPPGTQAVSVVLTVSDAPGRRDGNNIFTPDAALYGHCSWQGAPPAQLLNAQVFRETASAAILAIPLLVPPGESALDFRILAQPAGWDQGSYSVRLFSGKQVLAETSFEIKAPSGDAP